MADLPQLYSLPEYYDIAFSRDLRGEIEFFRACFERYGRVPVTHILEPAAGSGMFLTALPEYGYRVTGYDINPYSVEYAQQRIARMPHSEMAGVMVGDMRSLTFTPPLDAAINTNNTISYLLSDDDLRSHLRSMAVSLRAGAVYVLEISCAHETAEHENLCGDTWTMERDGIRVVGTWRVEGYDLERKIRRIHCRMEVDHRGSPFVFEEKHELRLWYAPDLERLAGEGGFAVAAVYNGEYQMIPPGTRIAGEMGNLYFVLVNRQAA